MDFAAILLPATAVGAALIAGILGAFSIAVMPALRRLPPAVGTSVMQTVNRVILNPLFLLPYVATTIACVILPFTAAASPLVVAGALLYIAGGFLVTGTVNVPLNNQLDRVPPGSGDHRVWERFLARWTRWNHIRSLACLVAAGLLAAGI